MKHVFPILQIALVFVWAGMIIAISFMEAWLKFTAPGVTLMVGRSIGDVIFHALNGVEITLTVVVALCILMQTRMPQYIDILFLGVVAVVMIQSLWLLPELSSRVTMLRDEHTPEPSNMHLYFIILETAKLIFLLIYGFKQLTIWKTLVHVHSVKL